MTTSIIYLTYSFCFFVIMYLYYKINKQINFQYQFISTDQIAFLNKRHLLASIVMCLAIIANSFQPLTDLGMYFYNWNKNYTWLSCTLFFLAFTISVFAAKKDYKHSAISITHGDKIFYLLIRVIFLVVYEFFFRVVLLQAFYFLPITSAVIINVSLYSSAHIFSGKKEIIGSVPFGLALCLLTIVHQSVWPAIILHLILCFTYEVKMLYSKELMIKNISI